MIYHIQIPLIPFTEGGITPPFNKGRSGGILRTNQWLFVSTIP
jgi:hypothetical protein